MGVAQANKRHVLTSRREISRRDKRGQDALLKIYHGNVRLIPENGVLIRANGSGINCGSTRHDCRRLARLGWSCQLLLAWILKRPARLLSQDPSAPCGILSDKELRIETLVDLTGLEWCARTLLSPRAIAAVMLENFKHERKIPAGAVGGERKAERVRDKKRGEGGTGKGRADRRDKDREGIKREWVGRRRGEGTGKGRKGKK